MQSAESIEGQTRGIHQLGDERSQHACWVDAINGDRSFLAARTAERGEEITAAIDHRAGDRMQAIREHSAHGQARRLARRLPIADCELALARSVGDAGDDELARTHHERGVDSADANVRPGVMEKTLPWMCTSPPGMAAAGLRFSMIGRGPAFCVNGIRNKVYDRLPISD